MDRSRETLLFRPNTSGVVSVCLAYPNTYRVGMANLGYQAVFRILATQAGVVCERAFLDDDAEAAGGSPARAGRGGARPGPRTGARRPSRDGRAMPSTLETGRSPAELDVLAFSVSFEADYPNLVRFLDRSDIPARVLDRRASGRAWPLVLAGGPATFLNPEPIAPFVDVFLIGEAEEMLPEALDGLAEPTTTGWSFGDLLARFSAVEGAYRPDLYEPEYDGAGDLIAFTPRGGAPARVKRRYVTDLDARPVTTAVAAPDAVFGDYFLVEASRGCEWGCRFCAAGYMYRPVRHRSAQGVTRDALEGLRTARTVGLVGAEMASHPGIAGTCERVAQAGGRVSPSSLKADVISPRLARALAAGGTRSVTVAPEAGSERMRRVINKNLTESEILRATELLVGDGVESLKLYFMCALPTETVDDLDGIVDLTERIRARMLEPGRARGRVGRIKVSLNPFVPKPWTPFQWDPMIPVADAQKRLGYLRRRLGRIANVDVETESAREAYLQTFLSRGDRRTATVVEALARDGRGWWAVLKDAHAASGRNGHAPAARSAGRASAGGGAAHGGYDGGLSAVDPHRFVHREYGRDALFPWDFIDHHIDKAYLWLERRRAFAEQETEPCDVATCRTCGACAWES